MVWLVLACLTISACQAPRDDVSELLRDYRARVLTLLDVDPNDLTVSSVPALPPVLRKRELLLPVVVESVGLLEFFELQECDLGTLVGQRSGTLGKLAPLSERLTYELQFLNLAQRCLASNESLPADARALIQQIVERKLGYLDRHVWNALFAGPEMLHRLGSADGNLSEFATQLTDLRDLSARARTIQDGWQHWNQALERLSRGGGVGVAIERWRILDQELGLVVAGLKRAGGDVCRNGQPTPRVRNLKSTLEEFFVVRVRAKLATDLQRDESWVRSMNALADDFTTISPPAFKRWRGETVAGVDSIWQRSQSRLTEHAQAWAALLDRCGVPVSPRPTSSQPSWGSS